MKYFIYLFIVITFLNLTFFVKAEGVDNLISNESIVKYKIYKNTHSPNGMFEIVMLYKGTNEVEVCFLNTKTKKFIGKIDRIGTKTNITAIWNAKVSRVALLIKKEKVGDFLSIFNLEKNGTFKEVLFDCPDVIKNNKKLEEDSKVSFRQDICGLGHWIDNNTVSLVIGRYYHYEESEDVNYLTSFNAHIIPNGKAEIQDIKVIGTLTDEEYDAFVAKHNYQF